MRRLLIASFLLELLLILFAAPERIAAAFLSSSSSEIKLSTLSLKNSCNNNKFLYYSPIAVQSNRAGVSLRAFWNNNNGNNKPKGRNTSSPKTQQTNNIPNEISQARKKQLGIVDEREYDLDLALERNTDPLITKIIAGSFILVVIGLLVAGIIVPSFTDYGDGVCNPIRTAGRC
jgi:hypothetical protein